MVRCYFPLPMIIDDVDVHKTSDIIKWYMDMVARTKKKVFLGGWGGGQ